MLSKKMLEHFSKLISFESVYDENTISDDTPFGIQIKQCLEYALSIGKEMGLNTVNKKYYGYVDLDNKNEDTIGILAHLDVVPAGNLDWKFPKFKLSINDEIFYGRGVADNKGAVIAAYEAIRQIKEEKINLKRNIRLILGCNEENGSICMQKYNENKELIPKYSLVPDSTYPLVFYEKAILHLKVIINTKLPYKTINSGLRYNIVPNSATAIDYNDEKIIVKGISSHASTPNEGVNAIENLLKNIIIDSDLKSKILFSMNINQKYDLKFKNYLLYKIMNTCDEYVNTSVNLGMLKYDNNQLKLYFDLRLPKDTKVENIIEAYKEFFKNSEIIVDSFAPALYIDPNSYIVKKLLEIFKTTTGLNNAKPLALGGGTYARMIPNAIAFGMMFENYNYNIHNANESLPIKDLEKTIELLKKALISLCT